jgi:hypothetical protein
MGSLAVTRTPAERGPDDANEVAIVLLAEVCLDERV